MGVGWGMGLKMLKMVREDFIKKAELHLKGKSRSGESRRNARGEEWY